MSPIFQYDFFYKLSKPGREFKKNCDFVHEVSDDIINKRRESLVSEWTLFLFYPDAMSGACIWDFGHSGKPAQMPAMGQLWPEKELPLSYRAVSEVWTPLSKS